MAITTSSGERYDSEENFIAGQPSEYIDYAFRELEHRDLIREMQPFGTIINRDVTTQIPLNQGDWESRMITDFPPESYVHPDRSNIQINKDMKQWIEQNQKTQDIMDKLKLTPSEKGQRVRPGEEDYIRSKDLGKPVIYGMNDNIPPSFGTTVPNITGLEKPPKPANDNDKRKPM